MPWENPFKQIIPVIPMISHDFIFEGSVKAAEDPVKAQILQQAMDVAKTIPPGYDEQGNPVTVNMMAMFREFLKKINVAEDIEDFFTQLSPEQLMMMQMQQQQAAGGQGNLGAVTPGDMLAGVQPNAGVRKETT
jgi:hypothetical protein